ncbi:MAG TPA: polysaccharide biosynthesis/export family protein [Pyrinomonadaceae bacterium]|jgi:protein involved in polysaccharide export with SLBB domain
MVSKFLALVALACCLCAPAALAQPQGGRVGPVDEVPAAGSAPGKPAPKPTPANNAAKSAPPKAAPARDEAKREEPAKDETKKDAANAPASKGDAPTLTAAANTSAESAQPNTTTDAPPKAGTNAAAPGAAAPVGLIPPPPKYEPPAPQAAGEPVGNKPNAAPAPPTNVYRVGVGDILDIRLVNGTARDSTLYTILSGGTLDYPLAGDPLSVGGLTPEEIGTRLAAELKRRGIYDRAQFSITVRDYVSHTVMVSGLVDQPGPKVLRREAVPLYVVLADALPRADAGRAVIRSRTTGASRTVDLADPAGMNELVAAGDVVTLQTRPPEFYYIGGQIGAPGQKDFHAGLTLTQALLASGGVTRGAGEKVRVVVSRQGADGRLIATEYLLKEIETGRVPDPRLQPGDRVEVGRKR